MYKRHCANHLDTHVSIQVVSSMSFIYQRQMLRNRAATGAIDSRPYLYVSRQNIQTHTCTYALTWINPYVHVCACMYTAYRQICTWYSSYVKEDTCRCMHIHADISMYVSHIPRAYAIWIALYPVHMSCICKLYVPHIHTHTSIHMCVVCASDTYTYALAG